MFWEKKTKIRKHIIFYGRVQGVGFRYYAVQKANQLGLTGWVKNLYDGSVEMEVEGQEELIDQLIIFLQNRTYIWIERIDAKKIPLQQDRSFCEIY
jgi:acylphosphatase